MSFFGFRCDKSAIKLIKQIDKLFMYWFHKILWIKKQTKKGLYRSKAPFNGFV